MNIRAIRVEYAGHRSVRFCETPLEHQNPSSYALRMSTVEEIKRAIEGLPPEDVNKLTDWLLQRRNELWDRQMDEDAASGKLDFLFEEADAERAAGKLRDWPPAKS